MSDRTPKPGTTIYLLRDIPKAQLKKAQAALAEEATISKRPTRTLKQVLLRAIEKLAATHDRRVQP